MSMIVNTYNPATHRVVPKGSVVLDIDAVNPEADRALKVEHLIAALCEDGRYISNLELANQIEAQTKPPKPEEPTALGAVVEDSNGVRWTRVEDGEAVTRNPWYPAGDTNLQPTEYADIDAARKLSEGVPQ